jgi:protein SCO1/2
MKTESFRKTAQAIVWPAFAFIVLFTAWMVKQHLSQPDFANAVLYPETSRSIQPFSLIDVNKRVFDKGRLLGKWSFVFFGYTHCPDVCPLTLQTLGRAAELIEKRNGAADVQFIFVSVDPQRDNNELLKNYVTYFNPDFLGVSGSQQQLLAFSKALDAPFGKSDDTGSASYSVSHSAQIFLINPDAQRYALLPQPLQAGDIARDFYAIRAHYQHGV